MWLRFLRDSSRTRKSARIQSNSLYAQVLKFFYFYFVVKYITNMRKFGIDPTSLRYDIICDLRLWSIEGSLWLSRYFVECRTIQGTSRGLSHRAKSTGRSDRPTRAAHGSHVQADARTDAASWATAWPGDHSHDFPRTTTHYSNLVS